MQIWDSIHRYVEVWHDTWEVVGAVATTMAVVLAVIFVAASAKARRKAEARAEKAEERRDTDRRAADRERADARAAAEREARVDQALRVIAWTEVATGHSGPGRPAAVESRLHIANGSPFPVFDAEVFLVDSSTGTETSLGILPVLAGGADLERDLHRTTAGRVSAKLCFRDLRGVRWERREDGQLLERVAQGAGLR